MACNLLCFVLLLMLLGANAADLYKVLGVDKNANPREIQKAFHKLSLKYHPDKNKSKNAQAKFSEISNAYEILSDDEKRKQYDLTGDPSGQPRFEGRNQGGGFPGGFAGGFPGGSPGGQGGRPDGQRRNAYYNFQGPGGQQYQTGQDFEVGLIWGNFLPSSAKVRLVRKRLSVTLAGVALDFLHLGMGLPVLEGSLGIYFQASLEQPRRAFGIRLAEV